MKLSFLNLNQSRLPKLLHKFYTVTRISISVLSAIINKVAYNICMQGNLFSSSLHKHAVVNNMNINAPM